MVLLTLPLPSLPSKSSPTDLCSRSSLRSQLQPQGHCLSCYLCLQHFPPDLCIVSCFLPIRPQPECHSSGHPLMTSLCPVALFTSGCLIGFFTVYLWLNLNISRKGTRASSLPVTAVSPPLDKCLAPDGYSTNICCASCHRAGRKAPLGHIFLSFFVHSGSQGRHCQSCFRLQRRRRCPDPEEGHERAR